VSFFTRLYWSDLSLCRFKVELSDYPIISRIGAELDTLEAFIQASPAQQPDAPPDL